MASEPPGTQRIQLLVRPLSRALEIASNWSFTCKIPPHQKILIFSDEVKSFFILSWILLFIYQEERRLRESAIRFLVYHASYSWDPGKNKTWFKKWNHWVKIGLNLTNEWKLKYWNDGWTSRVKISDLFSFEDEKN